MNRFRPERAESIGIILHYECTYRCAHCLYACRPGLKEAVRVEDLERLLDSIAEACPGAALHVGGGEPFLHMDRLIHVIEGIRSRGLFLEYVETNGYWVNHPDAARWLQEVRRAGCSCLLLSISPFHNAFLSCNDNRKAYRMIVETFGANGIFAWHPAYYAFLERVDPSRPIPFEDYAQHFEIRELRYQLTAIHYLHLAGRAAWNLAPLLNRRPPDAYLQKKCHGDLSSPVHAHVDPYGHYLTGFCSGLQIGVKEAFRLESVFRDGVRLANHPLIEMLVRGSLGDLMRYAEGLGFIPDPRGYVFHCHLCSHIRTWLYHHLTKDKRPPELAPAFFYEELARFSEL